MRSILRAAMTCLAFDAARPKAVLTISYADTIVAIGCCSSCRCIWRLKFYWVKVKDDK